MIIKKTVILTFLALYFSATTGMALNLHYCGQKLANVQVNALVSGSCCAQKLKTANKCCQNKSIKIKLTEKHQSVRSTQIPEIKALDLFEILTYQHKTPDLFSYTSSQYFKPPPQAVPLGLKNCVFRI